MYWNCIVMAMLMCWFCFVLLLYWYCIVMDMAFFSLLHPLWRMRGRFVKLDRDQDKRWSYPSYPTYSFLAAAPSFCSGHYKRKDRGYGARGGEEMRWGSKVPNPNLWCGLGHLTLFGNTAPCWCSCFVTSAVLWFWGWESALCFRANWAKRNLSAKLLTGET